MPFVAYRDTQPYCGGQEAEEEDGVVEEEGWDRGKSDHLHTGCG